MFKEPIKEKQKKQKVKDLLFDPLLSLNEIKTQLPSDFCENPPLLGDENDLCNLEFPLGYSYIYQDVCIEHKDAEVYLFELFTEAVGDIFREIPKIDRIGYGSKEYICEKMTNLKRWIDASTREKSFRERMTEDRKQILHDHQKRVAKWLNIMRTDLPTTQRLLPICEGQELYARAQEESILLMQELLKWGLEEKPTSEMKSDIYAYIADLRQLLHIEKPYDFKY